MSAKSSWVKDPSDVMDYMLNWATWLAGDAVATSSWEAESGITIDSSPFTATTATVWLSGGSAGRRYTVTNTIVTLGARTKQQSIRLAVQDN